MRQTLGDDPGSILAAYDAQMRVAPPHDRSVAYETVGDVVRATGCDEGCIVYSKLDASNAEAVISREIEHFAALGRKLEWKVYAHDLPRDLGARLLARGFEADEPETLMALPLTQSIESVAKIDVRRAGDHRRLRDLIAVHDAAFGEKSDRLFEALRPRLRDPMLQLFVAYEGERPVSAGRLELPENRSFASLWGGGTIPEARGCGFFRALVAIRVSEARRRGYRYVTVDARESSRPILERLGFVKLTTITGYVI